MTHVQSLLRFPCCFGSSPLPLSLTSLLTAPETNTFEVPCLSPSNTSRRTLLESFCCIIYTLGLEPHTLSVIHRVLSPFPSSETPPLPDTGQWILLSLNERLPPALTSLLRARLIELHHFLFLFVLLGFSVLFNCIPPPGLGLAARYAFTMGVGRILRFLTFAATILPAVRPWCAQGRFGDMCARHPHPWAQKYYLPYARNHDMMYRLLTVDRAFGE